MRQPDAEATREHWNRQAVTYSADKARNEGYYGALKALFDDAVPADKRGSVLDVGCGTGEILAHLRPARGVGTDLSEGMIERARTRFAETAGLSFEVIDATGVPALGPFDAVISADVLEHVPDWAAVLESMVDAARPGGLVVASTPSPSWALPLWILEKLSLKMPEGPHRWVALRDIVACLERRGCRIVRAGTHLLVPARVLGLGPRLSAIGERAPLLRHLGVVQLVVAERGDR